MKKIEYFIMLLFISLATMSISQIRIGYTPEEIKLDYVGYENTIEYTDSGHKFLTVYDKNVMFIYVFDSSNKSIGTSIVPDNKRLLADYIALFDQKYTKISEGIWNKDSSEGIIRIELIKDGVGYFMCRKE